MIVRQNTAIMFRFRMRTNMFSVSCVLMVRIINRIFGLIPVWVLLFPIERGKIGRTLKFYFCIIWAYSVFKNSSRPRPLHFSAYDVMDLYLLDSLVLVIIPDCHLAHDKGKELLVYYYVLRQQPNPRNLVDWHQHYEPKEL